MNDARKLITRYLEDCQIVYSVNLDMDGDYKKDVYYSFKDDAEQLEAAILASLGKHE